MISIRQEDGLTLLLRPAPVLATGPWPCLSLLQLMNILRASPEPWHIKLCSDTLLYLGVVSTFKGGPRKEGIRTETRIRGPGSKIPDAGSLIQDLGSLVQDLGQGSWIQNPGSRLISGSWMDQGSRIPDPVSWIPDPRSFVFFQNLNKYHNLSKYLNKLNKS